MTNSFRRELMQAISSAYGELLFEPIDKETLDRFKRLVDAKMRSTGLAKLVDIEWSDRTTGRTRITYEVSGKRHTIECFTEAE
jgi:hypothetical protein